MKFLKIKIPKFNIYTNSVFSGFGSVSDSILTSIVANYILHMVEGIGVFVLPSVYKILLLLLAMSSFLYFKSNGLRAIQKKKIKKSPQIKEDFISPHKAAKGIACFDYVSNLKTSFEHKTPKRRRECFQEFDSIATPIPSQSFKDKIFMNFF